MARRGPTIADGALELIRERGPQTIEELAPVLAERGRTKAKVPLAAVKTAITDHPGFVEGRAGRWYSLADQLEGATFTVRPTGFERREEIVLARADLALLERLLARSRWREHADGVHLDLLGHYLDLPRWDVGIVDVTEDGELVFEPDFDLRDEIGAETAASLLDFMAELGLPRGEADDENLRDLVRELEFESVFHGPRGWMPTLRSREMLGLRVEGGAVRAVAVDRREASGIHVEAAAARLARLLEDVADPPLDDDLVAVVSMESVLHVLVTEAPETFRRPLPPISEVVRLAGWETAGAFVGPPGTDWEELTEGAVLVGDPWDDDPRAPVP